jgi:predicted P-loop ATPase
VGEWRDQLWAEAVSLWRGGFRLFLPPHLDREARRIGSEHSLDQNCAMFDDLDRYLEMELPDNWRSLDRATRRRVVRPGAAPSGMLRGDPDRVL